MLKRLDDLKWPTADQVPAVLDATLTRDTAAIRVVIHRSQGNPVGPQYPFPSWQTCFVLFWCRCGSALALVFQGRHEVGSGG